MTDIITAIRAINSNAEVTVSAEDINQIVWHKNTPVISNEDILAKQTELQAAEDAAVAQKATDKASAKAKLIAGEALTEAEADTIVI
jgi:hypothetical protein